MKRRELIKTLAIATPAMLLGRAGYAGYRNNRNNALAFMPTWQSLAQYQVPQWFRDAKFGMWAHWGPQCEPEYGDWYARGMYEEGSDQYNYHCKKYGHPSKFGFKDVIHQWKADKWYPFELVSLYKKTGARYFIALANHHDNFDLYKSRHQPWNATRMGPKKDLIAGWAKAAKQNGLPFGVSIHAAHAWRWMETAQRADKNGDLAGIPYDGHLTQADGRGTWWQGEDPQQLYAQNHPLSRDSWNNGSIHGQWNWGNGAIAPSKAYCEQFYHRTMELIERYNPELLYFDDTALPLWPVSDVGLQIAANLYNLSIKKHGQNNAVIFGKILDQQQRQCMVWDIERGQSNQIEPLPWQTDTCIGGWHYDRRIYENGYYKSAKTIIHTLVDVVSKNGNLLLNIPVRGNGTIDEKERTVVEGIGEWMQVHSESIYATRPWKIFGEGPALDSAAPLSAQGFNEGKGQPLGAADFRYVKKDTALYVTFFAWPNDGQLLLKALGHNEGKVTAVQLLGRQESLKFDQSAAGLRVQLPSVFNTAQAAYVLKITGIAG